ncbi:hypothetical protein BJ878DRAFT_519312 [Calycina marina]|uniref:MOSC domain-containing protein n=1 Tax=Calycina marina TaxID=1763456 RepID=A0A9P7YXS7_9HELO|nr:hypothetical protein BJ878DRAFT_519312 [Calycina marina]
MSEFSRSWATDGPLGMQDVLRLVGTGVLGMTVMVIMFIVASPFMKTSTAFPPLKKYSQRSDECNRPSLEITQLWIYPIKSLRGCKVQSAVLEKSGFKYDRRFMLLKVTPEKLVNMQVSKIPEMCLFHTSIQHDKITVTYWSPESKMVTDSLDIPLQPSVKNLKTLSVEMYGSVMDDGYNMGPDYNDWFTKLFGFQVILAYWGGNTRPVLGNRPGRSASEAPPSSTLAKLLSQVPVLGTQLYGDNHTIAFNDMAPYLVVTEESLEDICSRLPSGVDMEICKFRGNIIVRNATAAFDEDYWGELTFGQAVRLILTANCIRCVSLVVDYETGKSGTGKAKDVYKLLSKDRRVDKSNAGKWSPVFGRYGFVDRAGEGNVLKVGHTAVVSKRNSERTVFAWPGI